jgi:ComF family protein
VAILSTAAARVREWGDAVLSLAFPFPASDEAEPKPVLPPCCSRCGYPYEHVPDAPFVCSSCADTEWSFAWARAGYLTEGQVHEAVVGFKYEEQFFRLRQLSGWLTEAFDRYAAEEKWDALVPVPLYHRRQRERGFNQARELAGGLSRRRGVPVWSCLRRLRETPSQTGLERRARRENMRNAFGLKGGFDVSGRNLLLIDDVFTTGATTNACAHVLAQAGAGRLAVLTVSRS